MICDDEITSDFESVAESSFFDEQRLHTWKGKRIKLKESKVNLVRLPQSKIDKQMKDSDRGVSVTRTAKATRKAREYSTRHKSKQEKSVGKKFSKPNKEVLDLGEQDDIMIVGHSEHELASTSVGGNSANNDKSKNPDETHHSINEGLLKAVQNKSDSKIMSDESEAFSWDWILKKD